MILYSVNSPLYCSAVVLNLKSDVKIQLQGSFNEDTTPEDFFPEFADLTGMCVWLFMWLLLSVIFFHKIVCSIPKFSADLCYDRMFLTYSRIVYFLKNSSILVYEAVTAPFDFFDFCLVPQQWRGQYLKYYLKSTEMHLRLQQRPDNKRSCPIYHSFQRY